jgi:hypothetical protein
LDRRLDYAALIVTVAASVKAGLDTSALKSAFKDGEWMEIPQYAM